MSLTYDDIRELLSERRRQLAAELDRRMGRLRAETPPNASSELLNEVENAELDVTMVEMLTAAIRAVDNASERLARGTYGACTVCGTSIGDARLRAMPFAIRCLDCKEASERGPRTRRRPTEDLHASRESRRVMWPSDIAF